MSDPKIHVIDLSALMSGKKPEGMPDDVAEIIKGLVGSIKGRGGMDIEVAVQTPSDALDVANEKITGHINEFVKKGEKLQPELKDALSRILKVEGSDREQLDMLKAGITNGSINANVGLIELIRSGNKRLEVLRAEAVAALTSGYKCSTEIAELIEPFLGFNHTLCGMKKKARMALALSGTDPETMRELFGEHADAPTDIGALLRSLLGGD